MTKKHKKYPFLNLLGALGYGAVFLQWAWSSAPLLAMLFANQALRSYIMPEYGKPAPAIQPLALPGWLQVVIVIACMLFVIVTLVYAFFFMPREVGKAGKAVVQKATSAVLPAITHHKKITEKKRKRLVEYITWSVKLTLIGIPLLFLFVSPPASMQLSHELFSVFGILLSCVSISLFGLQYIVAKLSKVPAEKIW